MVKAEDVFERVKDVICFEYKDQKVLDKHVAYELGIDPASFATKKYRNLLPYDEITMFAIRRKISINWLLFGIGKMEMDYAK